MRPEVSAVGKAPAFDTIVYAVWRVTGIPTAEILGTRRLAPIAEARHLTIYLVREIRMDSWKHIAQLMGGRDHTSMMHAHRKMSRLVRDVGGREIALAAQVRSVIRRTEESSSVAH